MNMCTLTQRSFPCPYNREAITQGYGSRRAVLHYGRQVLFRHFVVTLHFQLCRNWSVWRTLELISPILTTLDQLPSPLERPMLLGRAKAHSKPAVQGSTMLGRCSMFNACAMARMVRDPVPSLRPRRARLRTARVAAHPALFCEV